MNVAMLRDAIVAKLQGVPGIGVVHDHERYAKAMDALRTFYVSPGESQLRGWFLRRQATAEVGAGGHRRVEKIDWRIQGVMALDDAAGSELVFDGLVEAVRDAFRADPTLGGRLLAGVPDGDLAGIQVVDAGPVMFAGVLCHAARLVLQTRRLIAAR